MTVRIVLAALSLAAGPLAAGPLAAGPLAAGSLAAAAIAVAGIATPAEALSRLESIAEDAPANEQDVQTAPSTGPQLPEPDPLFRPEAVPPAGRTVDDGETGEDGGDGAPPAAAGDGQGTAMAGPVIRDPADLPEPVRRMRALMLEAAATGDPEALRALLGIGPNRTQLSISGHDGDPIDYLRSSSGDEQGQEILAILIDVLHGGAVRTDLGGGGTVYLWPYFFARPLGSLTPPERVELFRIVTAGDYADMRAFGGYNFYRVGISPDGDWRFFVAGD